MEKQLAHTLFVRLITGRNYDKREATISFTNKLITAKKDILQELPREYNGFVLQNALGNEMAFAFALLYEYHMSAGSNVMLAIGSDTLSKGGTHFAISFDERGYQRFAYPGKALRKGYIGQLYDMSLSELFEEMNLGTHGQIYMLDPFGEYGRLHFFNKAEFNISANNNGILSHG